MLPIAQTKSPVFIVASRYLAEWFYHENMITCFDLKTIKAVHSWLWWMEWLEGCGC